MLLCLLLCQLLPMTKLDSIEVSVQCRTWPHRMLLMVLLLPLL